MHTRATSRRINFSTTQHSQSIAKHVWKSSNTLERSSMQIDVRKLLLEVTESAKNNEVLRNESGHGNTIQIIIDAVVALNKSPIVHAGEYVIDGDEYRRVASIVSTDGSTGLFDIQYAPRGCGCVYLGKGGGTSYSGSLELPVKRRLEMTGDHKLGSAWTFYDGYAGGHRGVYFEVPFRVYKAVPLPAPIVRPVGESCLTRQW